MAIEEIDSGRLWKKIDEYRTEGEDQILNKKVAKQKAIPKTPNL